MKNYEGRQLYLINRINKHLHKLTGGDFDFHTGVAQKDLIKLKMALADINNLLTFKTTISAVNLLCRYLKLDKAAKNNVRHGVDKTKPNSKGFDILINKPVKIIAEVKCISPVNYSENLVRRCGIRSWMIFIN